MKHGASASRRGFAVHKKISKRKNRSNGHPGHRNSIHNLFSNRYIHDDKDIFSVIEHKDREIISDDDNFSPLQVREDFIFD